MNLKSPLSNMTRHRFDKMMAVYHAALGALILYVAGATPQGLQPLLPARARPYAALAICLAAGMAKSFLTPEGDPGPEDVTPPGSVVVTPPDPPAGPLVAYPTPDGVNIVSQVAASAPAIPEIPSNVPAVNAPLVQINVPSSDAAPAAPVDPVTAVITDEDAKPG